ncbi:MAG: hypothetical protein ACFFD9_07650 [Candidatus Thorarchaeota archaeon]
MTDRLRELERIREEVVKDPENVPRETRKSFWRLVRQIKREPFPNDDEIDVAAAVRNILFEVDRGGTYRTGPALAIMTLVGFGIALGYLWLLGSPLDWGNVLGWTIADLGQFALRFLCVFGGIAFFYPLGRFIAGKVLGIRIEGMARDEYYEPTLKIDYVSFLKAPVPKRKWFFFFAGIWTIITSLAFGVMGFVVGGDFTAFIPMVLLLIFEGYAVLNGTPKRSFGEMGTYNREKKIERAWRKRLAETGR